MLEEAKKLIGKKAIYKTDLSLSFLVVIQDVKREYGNIRYLITPIKGSGERWVEKVEVIQENKKYK